MIVTPGSTGGLRFPEPGRFFSATGFSSTQLSPVAVSFWAETAILPTATGCSCNLHTPVAAKLKILLGLAVGARIVIGFGVLNRALCNIVQP